MRDTHHIRELRALDDQALGRLATAGDRDAFGELFARHEHGLLNFCHRLTGNRDEAADLVQESFLRVFAQLDRLDGRDVNLAAYLRRVARNLVYDRAPRRAVEVAVADAALVAGADTDIAVDPERAALLAGQQEEVRAANAMLGERQRLALALRELEGMDYRSIGDVLGLKQDAVAQLVARARLALRRGLRLQQVDEDAMSDSCRGRLVAISALLDGELDDDRRHVLTQHLETCATCRATRGAFEEAGQRYRLWLPIPIIAGLGAQVLGRAEEGGLLGPGGAVSGAGGGTVPEPVGTSAPAHGDQAGGVLSGNPQGDAGGAVSGPTGDPSGLDTTLADVQDGIANVTPDAGGATGGPGGEAAGTPDAGVTQAVSAEGDAGGSVGGAEGPGPEGADTPTEVLAELQDAVGETVPGSPEAAVDDVQAAVEAQTPAGPDDVGGGAGGGADAPGVPPASPPPPPAPPPPPPGGTPAQHGFAGAGAGVGGGLPGPAVPAAKILSPPEASDLEDARRRRRGLVAMAGAGVVALMLGGVSAVYALRDTSPPPPAPPPPAAPSAAEVTDVPPTTTRARRSAPTATTAPATATAPDTTGPAPARTPVPGPGPAVPASTAPGPAATAPPRTAPTRTTPGRPAPPPTVETAPTPPPSTTAPETPPTTTTAPPATTAPPVTTTPPRDTPNNPNTTTTTPPTTTVRPPRTIGPIRTIRPPAVIQTQPPATTTTPDEPVIR